MIEVKQAVIGSENVSAVSARDLYLGLGLAKANWSQWLQNNIEKNEFFVENKDWVGFMLDVNGNETRDFAISIEMAKHLAMMAKTTNAHDYRNYFIECEKKANQPLSHLEILVQSAMALVEHERKMKALEEKVNHHYSQLDAKIEEVKAKTSASPDEYYSISGYAGLRGVNVDVHRAGRLGKVATRFSNENGYFIGKAHSELFGTVNSYHLDVLTDIFKKEK